MSERTDAPRQKIPPPAAAAEGRKATGTDTVTVACALPQGLWLDVYDVEQVTSFLPNGREIKENVATLNTEHGRYFIRGVVDRNALATAAGPDGANDILPDDYRLIRGQAPGTGFALTYGIPRDYWERWAHDNRDSALVRDHLIFSASSENRAVGAAREMREIKSGFQGLDPGGDYRVPRGGQSVRKYDRQDNRVGPEDGPGREE